MSHTRTISTRIRDPVALAAACRRLGLGEPTHETITLSSGPVTGWIVQLHNWHGPVVIDIETGQLAYDNPEGERGDFEEFSRLLHAYACEKARIQASSGGQNISERTRPDGSILISIEPGGVP